MPCPPGGPAPRARTRRLTRNPEGEHCLPGSLAGHEAGSRRAGAWPSLWNGVHSSKEEPMPDLSYRQPGLIMRKTGSTASNRQLRDLQKDLWRLGYRRSGIDGNFGDQTELAVKGLQHDLLEGARGGDDGMPAVLIRSYNRGRQPRRLRAHGVLRLEWARLPELAAALRHRLRLALRGATLQRLGHQFVSLPSPRAPASARSLSHGSDAHQTPSPSGRSR